MHVLPLLESHRQIWDPAKAKRAVQSGQDINSFLDSFPTYQKTAGLLALHNTGYNISDAAAILDSVKSKGPRIEAQVQPLSEEQAATFRSVILEVCKNFPVIAERVGTRVSTALVHYYRYFKGTDDYKILKKMTKKNSDGCEVCGYGGNLLCCDECVRAFHFGCLDPPLKSVPEGDWFCPYCVSIKQHKCGVQRLGVKGQPSMEESEPLVATGSESKLS